MLDFERPDGGLEGRTGRRSPVLGLLRPNRRPRASFFDSPQESADATAPIDYDEGDESSREKVLPRFSITRQGYDCVEVDEYLADLEKELGELDAELADLRARSRNKNEVAAELKRVGEQTSSILVTAHEKAQETMRVAEMEASCKIADAASNAAALTDEAKRKVRELEHQRTTLRDEHSKLVEEIRNLSTVLHSVAEAAVERVAPEPVGED